MNFGNDLKSINNIFFFLECLEFVCMYEYICCRFISNVMFGVLNFFLKFDYIFDFLMFLFLTYINFVLRLIELIFFSKREFRFFLKYRFLFLFIVVIVFFFLLSYVSEG